MRSRSCREDPNLVAAPLMMACTFRKSTNGLGNSSSKRPKSPSEFTPARTPKLL